MSKIKNGGPAFPVECSHVDGELHGRQTGNYTSWHVGLSMRDWFAGKAMQGYLASVAPDFEPIEFVSQIAECSYAVADAMLKARGEA